MFLFKPSIVLLMLWSVLATSGIHFQLHPSIYLINFFIFLEPQMCLGAAACPGAGGNASTDFAAIGVGLVKTYNLSSSRSVLSIVFEAFNHIASKPQTVYQQTIMSSSLFYWVDMSVYAHLLILAIVFSLGGWYGWLLIWHGRSNRS